jgi:hypothetical protein
MFCQKGSLCLLRFFDYSGRLQLCLGSSMIVSPPQGEHDERTADMKEPKPPQCCFEINPYCARCEQSNHTQEIAAYGIYSIPFFPLPTLSHRLTRLFDR